MRCDDVIALLSAILKKRFRLVGEKSKGSTVLSSPLQRISELAVTLQPLRSSFAFVLGAYLCADRLPQILPPVPPLLLRDVTCLQTIRSLRLPCPQTIKYRLPFSDDFLKTASKSLSMLLFPILKSFLTS